MNAGLELSKAASFWGNIGWWEWFVEPGHRIISIESDREAPTYVSSLIVENDNVEGDLDDDDQDNGDAATS